MAVVQQNQQDKNLQDPNQSGMPSDGSMNTQQPQQQPNQISSGQSATIQSGAPAQQPQQTPQQGQGQQAQAPKLGQGVAERQQQNQPGFSRFQTLQRYISQNEGLGGDRLKQTAAENVGQRAEGFRQAIDQGQQQTFGTFVSEQQRTGQEAQDQELFQQAQAGLREADQFQPEYTFGDISQRAQEDVMGLAQDQTDMRRFEQLRDQIVNKAQIDEQAIQGGLQSLNQMRNLREDAGDRANLLRQTFGEDPQQYSQAARNLDSFLLEQDRGFLGDLQQRVEDTISSEAPKVDELYNLRDMVNQQIEQMGAGASEQIRGQLEGQRAAIDEALRQRADERVTELTQMQDKITQKMQFGIPLTEEETQFINLSPEDFEALNQLMQVRDPSRMLNVGARIQGFDGQEYLAFDDRFDQLQEMGLIGDLGQFQNLNPAEKQLMALTDPNVRRELGYNSITDVLKAIAPSAADQQELFNEISKATGMSVDNVMRELDPDTFYGAGYDDYLKQHAAGQADGHSRWGGFRSGMVTTPFSREEYIQNEHQKFIQDINSQRGYGGHSPNYRGLNFTNQQNQQLAEALGARPDLFGSQEILNRASGVDLSNLGLGGVVDGFSGTAFDNDVVRNIGNQQGAVRSLLQVAAPKYDLSQFLKGVTADDIYSGSMAQGSEIDEYNTMNRLLLGGEDLRQEDMRKLGFDREGLTQQYLPEDFQPAAIGGAGQEGGGFDVTGSDFLTGMFSPSGLEATGKIASDVIGNATQNPLTALASLSTGGILPAGQTATKVTANTLNEMDTILNKAGLGMLADGTIRPLKEINRTLSGALGGVGKALSSGWGCLRKVFSDENLKTDIRDGNEKIEKVMDEMSEIRELLQKAG